MRWFTAAGLVALAALSPCSRPTHEASVQLHDGTRITVKLRGVLSLHSDWDRKMVIENDAGRVTVDLLGDTGWWRGSNLYRTASGMFVLDEGQAGCTVFRTDPPRLDRRAVDLCTLVQSRPAAARPPAAEYLGSFDERSDGDSRAVFVPATDAPELDLPEAI